MDTYHPVHYGEAQWLWNQSERIMQLADELEQNLLERLEKETGDTLIHIKDKNVTYASFYELIYYPAAASMNRYRCSYPAAGIFSMQSRGV